MDMTINQAGQHGFVFQVNHLSANGSLSEARFDSGNFIPFHYNGGIKHRIAFHGQYAPTMQVRGLSIKWRDQEKQRNKK
jgi:hypothetical protein